MAFLQNFEHDVFISYAHVDNLADREGEKGWVEQFERQLSVRLLKRLGEPVAVWRDPELDRAQRFDAVIEKAVRGAGILIALISRRYLKSDYCRQEIGWFRDKAEAEPAGLTVDDYVRVFPVLLYNLPPDQWPEVCRGTSAFRFHDGESDDLGEPMDPGSEAFNRELGRLVKELDTVLGRLEARGGEADDAPPPEGSTDGEAPFRVFVSCPSDDLRPTHRQIVDELGRHGVTILAGAPPPYDPEEHAQSVRQALERADLSIHLLSAFPGMPMQGDDPEKTYLLEQARLGAEYGRSQLILMPEELDLALIEEPFYKEYVDALWEKDRDAGRLEVVQTGRHQMLAEILAKRQRLEEAAKRSEEAASGAPRTAFIDLHMNDLTRAGDLVGYLNEKQISPMMVPAVGPAQMSIFEDHLRKADLFLVVYGAVNREWVAERINSALQLMVMNDLRMPMGVYAPPPGKDRDDMGFGPLVQVLNNTERFDPETLQPFLEKA